MKETGYRHIFLITWKQPFKINFSEKMFFLKLRDTVSNFRHKKLQQQKNHPKHEVLWWKIFMNYYFNFWRKSSVRIPRELLFIYLNFILSTLPTLKCTFNAYNLIWSVFLNKYTNRRYPEKSSHNMPLKSPVTTKYYIYYLLLRTLNSIIERKIWRNTV